MQTSAIYTNESVCFMVLVASENTLDIVRNFMALVVVAEFEDYLYLSLRDEPVKQLLSNESFQDTCLTISRTSSRRARAKVPGNLIEDIKLDQDE